MKPAERIDRSFVLARPVIELLLDNGPVPAHAEIVLRLAPHPRVVIDFDFPKSTYDQATAYNAINQLELGRDLSIRISPGNEIRTLVGGEWRIGGDSWCGGMLIPTTQPVTAVHDAESMSRCKFVLINFPSLRGEDDIDRPSGDNTGVIVQRMLMQAGSWSVEITGVDAVMGLDHRMRTVGGSAITHAGSITRADGRDFALGELDSILDGLHLFLSFARGSYCGLAFLSGQDSASQTVWKQWGSREVEPWRGPLSSWVAHGASEMLSPVFEGFWKRFRDPTWNDTLSEVMRWYLRSNESGESAVGIVLTQAALERLSNAITGKASGAPGIRIASALRKAGIDPRIPVTCPELSALAQRNGWSHGPHALVEVRNNLVHPNNRVGPVSPAAYVEARDLGQWYAELMLLREFDYSGRYNNRLRHAAGHGAPTEDVPWAVTSGGKS